LDNPLITGGFPASFAPPLALNEHDHFYFSKPIGNEDYWLLIPSQRYGVIQDAGELHNEHLGLDIGAHPATRIYAAAGGEVPAPKLSNSQMPSHVRANALFRRTQ
jgi:hypothetical protein